MYKKSVLACPKLFFFSLIRPTDFFLLCLLPALLSIRQYYILFHSAIDINESFAFTPWLNLYVTYMSCSSPRISPSRKFYDEFSLSC